MKIVQPGACFIKLQLQLQVLQLQLQEQKPFHKTTSLQLQLQLQVGRLQAVYNDFGFIKTAYNYNPLQL